MQVFVTGATGFIGSRIVPELIAAGHRVLGMTRSDSGKRALEAMGAEPFGADLNDLVSVQAGAARADAVIHCAFDHDFSRFVENCEKDRRVIAAMGEALEGSDRPLVITSGVGIGADAPGDLATEDVFNADYPNPRVASELAGQALLERGVDVRVVRLPQVHDPVKQGFITPYIEMSRGKGVVAWVGEGANRWPAAPVADVARLYVLALDKGARGERYHAVQEEGVAVRAIAEVVAQGLGLPTRSLSPEEATEHFGWFGGFVGLDGPASSAWTRERLGWEPTGPGLLEDLRAMDYAAG